MSGHKKIDYTIQKNPEAAFLTINLRPLDKLFVKTSTLTAKDDTIEIGRTITPGLPNFDLNFSLDSNLTINEVQAPKLPGSVYLFPNILGTIQHYSLSSEVGIISQIFSFLACSENIQFRMMSSPLIKQISEQDSFFVHLLGTGELWLSFYGNSQEISVNNDYIINLSYLVAFEDTLNYEIKQIDSLSAPGLHTGSVGEHNLFCHFKGIGKIWIQSRHRYAFLNFFAPFIH
ncbi:MAG: TIGR00266 family protein [Crocosphaera sp.]|nr:TIGR00266 family protein [Crocosphaera sp.]